MPTFSKKLNLRLFFLVSFCFFVGCASPHHLNRTLQNSSPYQGCLLYVEDAHDENLPLIQKFHPNSLLRSWYRWGVQAPGKEYWKRVAFINELKSEGITLGGGTTLTALNDSDLQAPDFDLSWRSLEIKGAPIKTGWTSYGTISAPGFRKYLISKLIEQAQLGVSELHISIEFDRELYFDPWSFGISSETGFIQWLRAKYPNRKSDWWRSYLSTLGTKIFKHSQISIKDFRRLSGPQLLNFQSEWGVSGTWKGENSKGEPAFLATLYHQNLNSFIGELRSALAEKQLTTRIDTWGFADWMAGLTNEPDAFISSPPAENWGINWSTDPNFSLVGNHDRILKIMSEQVHSVSPIPVVFMIDHPDPYDAFIKLSDERQVALTEYFAQLSNQAGAGFMFLSYSDHEDKRGPLTTSFIQNECARRRK